MGLPPIPRLAGMAGAIALAAVALFFLPALLGVGGDDSPTASRSPSPSPSRSIAPTATPVPTPTVYIIKPGDTLRRIAIANGISFEELLAANPGIKDPNKILVGQQIVIPAPSPAIPNDFGGSAEPSP
jgi:LysM repeat protein